MALFENFPYTNFHELNLDWIMQHIKEFLDRYNEYVDAVDKKVNKPVDDPNGMDGYLLKTNGDGSTEWIDYDATIDPKIQQDVNNWLEAHPEVTTTVQDDSLTTKKLFKNSLPVYCVTDYGIMPDTGDIYEELQTLLKEKVQLTGGIVYFPEGKYTISYTVFIPENTMFVGAGPETEIYFNEEDTYIGVGLANAGSNIRITNMKISQASTSTFHDGAQPGCVGFGAFSKLMVDILPNQHTVIRSEEPIHDLTIDNIVFVGKYALQTEPSTDTLFYNIKYANLNAANSCISVKVTVGSTIENFIAENIKCNLFRIRGTAGEFTSGIIRNFNLRNIESASYIFRVDSDSSHTAIYCENLRTTGETMLHDITPHEIYIAANITFVNCIFNLVTSIRQYQDDYYRKYINCTIICTQRLFNNDGTICETYADKTEFYSCYMEQVTTTGGQIIGYGKNNVVVGTLTNRIYGDCVMRKNLPVTAASGLFGNRFIHNYGINTIEMFAKIENTNELLVVPEANTILMNCAEPIPVVLWNTASPLVRITTYARVQEGVLKVIDNTGGSLVDSTAYNRVQIIANVPVAALPTMKEIYNMFA